MLTEEDTANSHQITVLIVDCTQSQWFPSPSCFRGSSYWLEKWTFSFAYNPYWIVMIVPAITQTRGQRKLAPVKTLDFDRKTHNYINQWSFFFCLWQATVSLPGHYQESMDSAPPRWPPFSPLIPDIGRLVRHFFSTLSQRATCFDKRTKRGGDSEGWKWRWS